MKLLVYDWQRASLYTIEKMCGRLPRSPTCRANNDLLLGMEGASGTHFVPTHPGINPGEHKLFRLSKYAGLCAWNSQGLVIVGDDGERS